MGATHLKRESYSSGQLDVLLYEASTIETHIYGRQINPNLKMSETGASFTI